MDRHRRSAIVLLILGALILGGGALILARALAWPEGARPLPPEPGAGPRVQAVLAQLFLREAGLSSRQDPLVLQATEVNAFLAGYVEVRDSPVWPIRVQIDREGVELGGATTVGRLVEAGLGRTLVRLLPGFVSEHPAWIAARGQVTVMSGGRAEFVANAATIGRQGVPVALLWTVVGGRPRTLAWRMPRVVERVEIEPGRLVIYTRHPRGPAAPPRVSGPRAQRSARRPWLSRT